MRKLASIQSIESLAPIPGRDRIEVAKLDGMGWNVIVKKGEFQPGSLCVYFEVDSILPKQPWSAFMEKANYRVKAMKMAGVISEGLALPLVDVLPVTDFDYTVDRDVTNVLGVAKYEAVGPHGGPADGRTAGGWPQWIPQTDEIRLQSKMGLLDELKGEPFYITLKYDGSSATFAKLNGELFVCSRTRRLKDPDSIVASTTARERKLEGALRDAIDLIDSNYDVELAHMNEVLNWQPPKETCRWWEIAKRYDFANTLPEGYAIQGEICGPGIQGNKLEFDRTEFFLFNVYNIERREYVNYRDDEWKRVRDAMMVNECQLMLTRPSFDLTLDQLLNIANTEYLPGQPAEGIVVRPLDERKSSVLRGARMSFKVINPEFLLRE